MTDAEKLQAYETLMKYCDSVSLNMNDTFAFASGDCEEMSEYDLQIMLPVILKYGADALVAYAAMARCQEPITCSCNHKNKNYYAAKKEIEAFIVANKYFMHG